MIVAGTGHRPPKLGGYTDEVFTNLVHLAEDMLRLHYRHNLFSSLGPMTVISGLALGWDQALAIAADYLGCTVWGYAPCRNQDKTWPQRSKDKYAQVLDLCEKVVYCYDGDYPGPWCMIKRDERMVIDADQVLALWDGTPSGGTSHTVSFATKKNKQVINCWKEWEEQCQSRT